MFIGWRHGNALHTGKGWRIKAVAFVAWLVGIVVHCEGVPFGRKGAA